MKADASLIENPLPKHIAIIMDGNGRWAKDKGLKRLDGHRAGALSVRKIVEECRRIGVRYLTLFSFSTENWRRGTDEVSGLMQLFRDYLESELRLMLENGIRLRAIGDLARLPKAVRIALQRDMQATEENQEMDLILAVSYGGREEILAATRNLAEQVKSGELDVEDINAKVFSESLWSAGIPDPDMLVRTSGEMRISNFLLWQLAYSEIVVVPELWPDFDEAVLARCLQEYSTRERRFGLTTEQKSSPEVNTKDEIVSKFIAVK